MTVKNFNQKFFTNMVEGAKNAVADSGNIVHEEILHLVLDTAKSGRVYDFRGGKHQASAPGQPFANMTGNALLNTKKYEENGGLTARIAGEAEYAAYLELGTSKMEPRPVFIPSISNKKKEIIKAFEEEIGKAARK